MEAKEFKAIIRNYYRHHGRHNLPWRKTKNPYHILVSEIMLQQTQVERVIPKYKVFLKKFPTFLSLAKAPVPSVLKAWQGLGYNRRALYLKSTAERVANEYAGKLPADREALEDLPGIGPNTAGAILAYAFNMPAIFIETNIRRIFIHFFFKNHKNVHDDAIRKLVAKTLDQKNPREWYSALMDYGTHLAAQVENPNRKSRHYVKQSKFEGSDRQLRGRILKIVLRGKKVSRQKIAKQLGEKMERVEKIYKNLIKEGFISL
jgi:A/G-specific adenine glycosylase